MENKPDFRILRTEANREDYEQLFYEIEKSFWGPTGSVKDKEYVAQGNPGQRTLFVMTLFARLVDNGGLTSFFECTPYYTPEVQEALKLLQFHDMERAFAEALAIIFEGKTVPEDIEVVRDMMDALTDDVTRKIDTITDRLYDGSGVEARLFPYFKQYVDAHPEEFFKD
jgi:hypothetical protein